MKILTRIKFISILILTLFILSGCSDPLEDTDGYNNNIDHNTSQLESSTRDDNFISCADISGSISYLVEYEEGVIREQRDLIRASLEPGYLICAQTGVCHSNENIELWVVRVCPIGTICKPLVSTPNNPELKTAFATCTD